MYNDNRPLHSAATLTEVTDMQQLELVNILLKYGADKALRNKANKLPIELVQQDRDRVGYLFALPDCYALSPFFPRRNRDSLCNLIDREKQPF